MINIINAKKYCREDISLIENYELAVSDTNEMWAIHHRDECKVLPSGITVIRTAAELKEDGRYYKCPANELIFLTNSEHFKLHRSHLSPSGFTGRHHSEEAKKSIRTKLTGRKRPLRNAVWSAKLGYWRGKNKTNEQKAKWCALIAERKEAYHLYKNNGGELKWNDWLSQMKLKK